MAFTGSARGNTLDDRESNDAGVAHPFDSNKRRKTGPSFFYNGNDTALDPSLVRPPTTQEQQTNIIIVENIGKQYQLAVKDHKLNVRDQQIRAKDARIEELEDEADTNEAQLTNVEYQKHALVAFIEEQEAIGDAQASRIKNLIEEVTDGLGKLAAKESQVNALQQELEAQRATMKRLEDRRFLDKTLEWFFGWVGITLPKTDSIATMSTQKAFPFMELPGELRNNIYKRCLVAKRPIDFWPLIAADAPEGTTRSKILAENLKGLNVGLMRTSKRVHYETVFILYGCNRFRFSSSGSWTVLEGFLLKLNQNCQFLTNVEVTCPEWFFTAYGQTLDQIGKSRDAGLTEMQPILKRFGMILDSPIGPSSHDVDAFVRASSMLVKLPHLKKFTITVPWNAQLFQSAIVQLGRIMTDQDKLLQRHQKPCSTPKRIVVFLRRPVGEPRVLNGVDMGDPSFMGWGVMTRKGKERGVEVQYATYGRHVDRTSYTIDGEEGVEYNVEFPAYIPPAGGAVNFLIKTVIRILGG
ncbi:hypothetical protein CC80DRAFT_596544 [Byssothecium circinans]|uniref:Uncharacterized protein n=1 Tax=Byssothecium circinans TaxID=147558 RepID=A0A6A5TKK4_9PLEO|nr:hypothetical protein CC80DRAFT_596544 [Byssothecium circinans]